MSYNGSGTFQINTSGQPVVAGTVISSTAFNALTADLATGLSTAITKDGQTTTTARIPFAAGINSSLTTDSTSTSTGSIITSGGVGVAKALYVGTNANIAGTLDVTGAVTVTNPVINNIKLGYTTTATAAGTTTLTAASNHQQFFTGTLAQTIVLPVTSTLALGMSYSIENNSTGTLTVQSSGLNTIATIPAGVTTQFTCILITGTTAASWDYDHIGFAAITGTGSAVLATSPTITTPTISQLSSAAAANLTLQSAGTTAVTIDTSQNVGIGHSSPSSKLSVGTVSYGLAASVVQINGTSQPITNSGGIFNIGSTDATAADVGGSLGFTANGGLNGYPAGQISGRRESATGSVYSSYLAFTTSNSGGTLAERMRIDSSGNLIIAKTASSSLSAVGCYNETTGSGANMVIASNGFMIRSTSSLKYKKNVQDATHGLADLLKLRSVTYESKNENEDGIVYGGLIAEEVDAVGLTEFVQYADDKTPDALSYGNMVSLCIKAIQEQQALIQSLTARITALEAK